MTFPKTLLILLAMLAAVPAAAQEGEIRLRVGGAEGIPFTANCELKTAGGTESFSLKETVPFATTYRGSGLSCAVSADHRIEVEVAKGGSSSRSSVSGGMVRVNVGS